MTDSNARHRISFVIPALNEEGIIERTTREVVAVARGRIHDYEIILIDDGSTDATGEVMDSLAASNERIRVLHNDRNLGLGASYKRGVEVARFEYLMMLCGDGGLPATSLPLILDAIGKADIVVPFIVNLKRIKTPSRYIISRCYTHLLNLLFQQNLKYYNGLPVHKLEFLKQIDIKSTGFGFQGEVLTKLLKAGCSFVEVGVDGAEVTGNSRALTRKNVINVSKTILLLVKELMWFDSSKLRTDSHKTTMRALATDESGPLD
ncbi:MAG: glycosyltransferase family 2 protein [Hyphomicrobium sp.]